MCMKPSDNREVQLLSQFPMARKIVVFAVFKSIWPSPILPYHRASQFWVNRLLACEAQEAVTQIFVGLEGAGKLRCDRGHILVVYAARRHALVLGID